MKHTDLITKTISLLLFLAMAAYLGIYVYRSVATPTQTALSVSMTVQETGSASGLVFRDEVVLESGKQYAYVTAEDGRKVSAGSVVAVAYSDEDALRRANRQTELELEISRIKQAQATSSIADPVTRESYTYDAVSELAAVVSRHDMSGLSDAAASLQSLVLDNGRYGDSGALAALQSELNSMLASNYAGTEAITAPDGGVFSTILDGFEHLSPDMLEGLTPDTLYGLMEDRQDVADNAVGKLVCSVNWYYAAVMTSAEADRLMTRDEAEALELTPYVELTFGRYYSSPLRATVYLKGPVVSGKQVVVFAVNSALADTIAMRQSNAEILFTEYTGIRVPKEALRYEDAGVCVYVLTGMQAQRRAVTIAYEDEDFVLVEQSTKRNSLKAGNELIIEGGELYDGKLMN